MAHQRVRTSIVSQAKTFAYLHTILAMVIVLWTGATAQSSDCTNALISMSPCLNYITGNSSTPSSGCCQQLASVVRSQPQCLCEAVNGGGSSMGIKVNQTQALALPGACNVQTPSISRCNGKNTYGLVMFSFSCLGKQNCFQNQFSEFFFGIQPIICRSEQLLSCD